MPSRKWQATVKESWRWMGNGHPLGCQGTKPDSQCSGGTSPGCSALWDTLIESEPFPEEACLLDLLCSTGMWPRSQSSGGHAKLQLERCSWRDSTSLFREVCKMKKKRARLWLPSAEWTWASFWKPVRPSGGCVSRSCGVAVEWRRPLWWVFAITSCVSGCHTRLCCTHTGLCGLPGASVGDIMLMKPLSCSEWIVWFVTNPDWIKLRPERWVSPGRSRWDENSGQRAPRNK